MHFVVVEDEEEPEHFEYISDDESEAGVEEFEAAAQPEEVEKQVEGIFASAVMSEEIQVEEGEAAREEEPERILQLHEHVCAGGHHKPECERRRSRSPSRRFLGDQHRRQGGG